VTGTSWRVVLCEGYDDRAFWAGWLCSLGCRPLTRTAGSFDPWGRPLASGTRGFRTALGEFVAVLPYHGVAKLKGALKQLVASHATRPVSGLVLNTDGDTDGPLVAEPAWDRLRNLACGSTKRSLGRGPWALEASPPIPTLGVVWESDDPATCRGVPTKQTLERLVCSAIVAAHPVRGPDVADWLGRDPHPDRVGHKHHALAYLAKWFATSPDDFYRAIWTDADVRRELESRLGRAGATAGVEQVLGVGAVHP